MRNSMRMGFRYEAACLVCVFLLGGFPSVGLGEETSGSPGALSHAQRKTETAAIQASLLRNRTMGPITTDDAVSTT